MAQEERVGRISREQRKNVSMIDPDPAGPNAGFDCEEFVEATLRIHPNAPGTSYQIAVWNFENMGGNDWFEDVPERRLIPAGEDYVRGFRARTIDRFFCQVTGLPLGGNVDIFWTFA